MYNDKGTVICPDPLTPYTTLFPAIAPSLSRPIIVYFRQSQAYLMLAALDNHRLAALALGHKHRNGLDGLTVDLEQSYRKYA
ncbi:hypothetical protein DPMN_031700 [Dreissena polymorpha]|uniref:Uncharacterized protein n=1 Tax=Dreissena polymorpha TaxID=45954 RepID=A0A9D4M2T3_DREPO|nr:hypothetical protein DPMN_031700 [Dreissena polymorpha]